MIKKLLDRVTSAISAPATDSDNGEDRAAALRLSTAVLMIDVARADHVFEESEFDRVLQLGESHLSWIHKTLQSWSISPAIKQSI